MPGLGVVTAGSPDGCLQDEIKVFPAKLVLPELPDASSAFDRFQYRVHCADRLSLRSDNPIGGTDNNSPKIEELL